MPTDKLYQQVFYFCSPVGGGGGVVEKLRLNLTSAKVKLKLRLSFAIMAQQAPGELLKSAGQIDPLPPAYRGTSTPQGRKG